MATIHRSRSARRQPSTTVPNPGNLTVATWEDDPGDPGERSTILPIDVPAPSLAAPPLPSRISGAAPETKPYPQGSPQFRYWAAAAALRRTADFWGAIVGSSIGWQVGRVLPVTLDDGVDLNAFYTRGDFGDAPGLHFFHETVAGRTYYSCESPDVVCHEMGHAVLDALRPQLFDAQSVEAAAFHESFGDVSAMLSALQVESFRRVVLGETRGVLNRASRLSRLAEQLGAAIRVQHPDAVDRDCLRNAANSFFYRDPQRLPHSAPASELSSEPHSFSRVFTAAFLDVLAGVFKSKGGASTSADLATSARDAAQLLVAAVARAPIAPDYYRQVAAHMIEAGDTAPFGGRYRDLLKAVFVRRGILSLHGAIAAGTRPRRAAGGTPRRRSAALPMVTISGAAYGLSAPTLRVFAADEPRRRGASSPSRVTRAVGPPSPRSAAESFTEDLFQRGRVDVGRHGHERAGVVHPYTTKTHIVVREGRGLVLRRRTFDCGFRS